MGRPGYRWSQFTKQARQQRVGLRAHRAARPRGSGRPVVRLLRHTGVPRILRALEPLVGAFGRLETSFLF